MPTTSEPTTGMSQTSIYHIRIKGHLGPDRAEWTGGMAISLEGNGETLLTGPIVDQAALHGLLRKIRDLGIPLISIVGDAAHEHNATDDERDRSTRQGTGGGA